MNLILYILATWRLAYLLSTERGPWDVLGRLRDRLGVAYDDAGQAYGTNELAEMFLCVWCNSVWIGLIISIGYWLAPDLTFWACLPLSLSAGAILIERVVND